MSSQKQNQEKGDAWYMMLGFMGLPYDTPMPTDEEADESLRKEWFNVLRRLWLAYDKKIDAEQFKLYADELSNIPIGLLEPGIKALINDMNRTNYFPRLSEVRLAISNELKKTLTSGDLTDDNIDEWLNNQHNQFMARCRL